MENQPKEEKPGVSSMLAEELRSEEQNLVGLADVRITSESVDDSGKLKSKNKNKILSVAEESESSS